jgi:hypothetical protein
VYSNPFETGSYSFKCTDPSEWTPVASRDAPLALSPIGDHEVLSITALRSIRVRFSTGSRDSCATIGAVNAWSSLDRFFSADEYKARIFHT